MSVKEDLKLEARIDHALRRHELHSLEGFLQKEPSSENCCKELLLKVDQLVSRELDKKDIKNVSLLLNVIYKCSKCTTSSGEEWLTTAISQGLVQKITWYEKITNILICAGSAKNKALLTLTEDLFDIVMAVHDHNSDGKNQILENFISKTCCLVADTSVSTYIKQEAVRKLNLMLDTIPREARKRLVFTKDMMVTMSAVGKQILEAGDYDLQVGITEALCRMTSEAERRELASQWFPMEFITTAFKTIKDSEFETDCRKFLNLVNGMLGDKRRVFTFPCIAAHLDNYKFQAPSDEKLEEFWIDFNIGTQSISFYVSTDHNESHQWETVCINESEVDMYNVEEINRKTLLTVTLNAPTAVGQIKGSQIRICFASALDIADVARKVFGASKCKGFVKKQSISVAKTAVQIVFDESGSQILIPESQGSITSSKEVRVIDTNDIGRNKQPPISTPYLNHQVCKENSSRNSAKLVTPSRSKVSEASLNISVACGLKSVNSSASTKTPTLRTGRIKPPLEMISSTKRSMAPITNIKDHTRHAMQSLKQKGTASDTETVQAIEHDGKLSKGDDQVELVPDTQFTAGNNSVMFPGLTEKYLGLNKKHPMSTRQKEKISVSGEFLSNKEKACDIVDKQQTFCSVQEGKRAAKNSLARVTSNQKRRTETSDPCKSIKEESYTETKVKERTVEQRTCRNFSNTETSFSKRNPETERTKEEITDTAKPKGSRCVAKRKGREKNMNEKANCKDAAKTLVSKIGSKYPKEAVKRKQEEASFRPNLKKGSMQTNKEKNQRKNTKTKGSKQLNMDKAQEIGDDVYSFQSKGGDEPTIELGVSSIYISKQMVNIAVTSARSSSIKNSKSKQESEQKHSNPRKHLFSDTDTDRGGDDSKTDYSWLQDPGSKKKLNIVGYSRQKQGNLPKEKTVSSKAADISKPGRKQKAKQHKELYDISLGKKDAEETSKQGKFKHRERATGKRKNSMESCNSEAESEEEAKPPSRKQTPKYQHGFLTTKKEPKIVEHPNPTKMYKNPKMEVKSNKISAAVYSKPASPVYSSPGSVEQMRSEQYESDPELPTRHSTITHSSPSLSASPPEQQTPEEAVNISIDLKKVSMHWTDLNDKSASKQAKCTYKTGKKLDVGKTVQEPLYPAFSHLSKDPLTLDNSTVSGVNALEETVHEYSEQHVKIHSPVTNKSKTGVHVLKKKKDNTCASVHSGSSVRTSGCETACGNIHESGPTLTDTISYIKRINNERSYLADISTEGIDHEIKQKKIKLRPRKLFPSPDVQVPAEQLSSTSGNNTSTAATDPLDGSSSDVGMMCKQISKEFARKIQNRSRKMDYFTKQSLKSAQKHLTSVDVQVRECRIMGLEKFHQTVLEELENFEKDSQALKQMEKEFSNFWNQQTQILNFYHKNEQRRINSLKDSFEMNISDSKDYEEKIFNSEMHAMKENMKAVQERLLKEMQEEELLSVRRGLQSLFMSGTGPF